MSHQAAAGADGVLLGVVQERGDLRIREPLPPGWTIVEGQDAGVSMVARATRTRARRQVKRKEVPG